jgi:hypothetical protein
MRNLIFLFHSIRPRAPRPSRGPLSAAGCIACGLRPRRNPSERCGTRHAYVVVYVPSEARTAPRLINPCSRIALDSRNSWVNFLSVSRGFGPSTKIDQQYDRPTFFAKSMWDARAASLVLAYVVSLCAALPHPGATAGGGGPPSAASHVSETLIQDLPRRRRPRVTAAQCTE